MKRISSSFSCSNLRNEYVRVGREGEGEGKGEGEGEGGGEVKD